MPSFSAAEVHPTFLFSEEHSIFIQYRETDPGRNPHLFDILDPRFRTVYSCKSNESCNALKVTESMVPSQILTYWIK